ncbi:family 20 glycosylhydrolase [Psychrobium sp. 1_MG-2023]|uniref:family 20 glycosylhydrolase n=1 Tax=Psychrobium sp. 1_MG-2023 TaxID=3062624 RepID=UPI000C321F18|nr:family 20 glycosylhydrolase [Psychrobium sp. 1_MG-2023]MDP2559534.1 family 20 glycosylhydrolase [Psychrobium sp. 1_MG-2023]PKF59374.1 beta-N-acetylhexosaminidase [Alteromonadales bacterium alter-6D02]
MKKRLSTVMLSLAVLLSGCGSDKETTAPKNAVAKQEAVATDPVAGFTQASFDAIANSLDISFEHLTNIKGDHCDAKKADGHCFQARLSFTAEQAINEKNLSIYFSQVSPIQTFTSEGLTVEHINGDLHRLTLTDDKSTFKAGETKTIDFNAIYWSVSEHDAIPNYILQKEGFEPRIIASTKSFIDSETGLESLPFVKSYTDVENQFKRTPDDKTPWATTAVLFDNNAKLGTSNVDVDFSILPTPQKVLVPKVASRLDISNGLAVDFNGLDKSLLNSAVERLASLGVPAGKSGAAVSLSVNKKLAAESGSYKLVINKSGISIEGSDITGVYYGLQSIAGLVTVGKKSLPHVSISDTPHYQFRGMHVDVARNFLDKAFILELLDQMAAYKLNKLHLHLADDEGWRLQIPWLPELTDISSKRCLDFSERECLLPQLGAGLDKNSSVNGFYSVDDYQEILRAASARHIQVIPSLDMPGHSRSSVKAMAARYEHYKAQGDMDKATQYLLHDIEDKTEYSSVQFYNDNTLNVCMDSTYAFIDKVMDEVKRIHAEAGHPLTRYHIGADETAGAWVESPRCKEFLANNNDGITEAKELSGYFIERVAKLLEEKGIETAGWSDGMLHTRFEKMPKKVQVNAWDNLFWGGHKSNHKMINQDWEVVFSSPEVLYFDFPYEADPKEHGYYWAGRHTNTRKIFELMPDNLPLHAEIWYDRMETPFEAVDDAKTVKLPGKSMAGIQGQLWTETTRSVAMAQYKIYPRLLALAERAWHKPTWAPAYRTEGGTYNRTSNYFAAEKRAQRDNQWHRFAKLIAEKEMPKMDLANIPYRIPTVGAKVIDGQLHANVLFPSLAIEYRVDGGQWKAYQGPTAVSGKIEVRALSANGQRKGRLLVVKQ